MDTRLQVLGCFGDSFEKHFLVSLAGWLLVARLLSERTHDHDTETVDKVGAILFQHVACISLNHGSRVASKFLCDPVSSRACHRLLAFFAWRRFWRLRKLQRWYHRCHFARRYGHRRGLGRRRCQNVLQHMRLQSKRAWNILCQRWRLDVIRLIARVLVVEVCSRLVEVRRGLTCMVQYR